MCARYILSVTLGLGVAAVLAACSTATPDRTHLVGPNDRQYAPAHRQPHPQYYRSAGPASGSCINEPVARRPFPAYVIVARGENLCRIAKRYETTVQAIVDVNRLSSPMLAVGSRLHLPSPEYYAHSPFGQLRRR